MECIPPLVAKLHVGVYNVLLVYFKLWSVITNTFQVNPQPHSSWTEEQTKKLKNLGDYYVHLCNICADLWNNGKTNQSLPAKPNAELTDFITSSLDLTEDIASTSASDAPVTKKRRLAKNESDDSLKQLSEYLKKKIYLESTNTF